MFDDSIDNEMDKWINSKKISPKGMPEHMMSMLVKVYKRIS